jgi:transcriptional regulator with XRE-family HTH domain
MTHQPRRRGSWVRLNNREFLRVLIQDRKLSYRQIGDMAGCDRSMISQLVNGHRSTCTEDLARVIARILNVPLDLIFTPNPSAISSRSDKRRKMREDAA